MLSVSIVSARPHSEIELTDISFEIGNGEALSVLGPNGCGKSTLLDAISLIQLPDDGRIVVDGKTLHDPENNIYGQPSPSVMYATQSARVWPTLTVKRNLMISGHVTAERFDHVVDSLGLQPLLARRVWQLSGGEKQRVSLARALVTDATTLLVDEPTNSLSIDYVEALLDLLRARKADGTSLVVVTHSAGFSRAIADRFLFMDDGKDIAHGNFEELRNSSIEQVRKWIALQ